MSPLLGTDQDWDIAKLDRLVDHIAKSLRVDRARIYLTGLSRGGHASWRWAIAEPKRFAVIAPVAGRGNPGEACRLMDLPVWAFHGDRDDVVIPEGSFTTGACDPRLRWPQGPPDHLSRPRPQRLGPRLRRPGAFTPGCWNRNFPPR